MVEPQPECLVARLEGWVIGGILCTFTTIVKPFAIESEGWVIGGILCTFRTIVKPFAIESVFNGVACFGEPTGRAVEEAIALLVVEVVRQIHERCKCSDVWILYEADDQTYMNVLGGEDICARNGHQS